MTVSARELTSSCGFAKESCSCPSPLVCLPSETPKYFSVLVKCYLGQSDQHKFLGSRVQWPQYRSSFRVFNFLL